MRMLNPVHPGRFLRTEILDVYELSVNDAAKALGVSRPTLSSLLNAKAGLSGEMALRFEKAFGVDMETLMRMQNSFDIACARRRAEEVVVERFVPSVAAKGSDAEHGVLLEVDMVEPKRCLLPDADGGMRPFQAKPEPRSPAEAGVDFQDS